MGGRYSRGESLPVFWSMAQGGRENDSDLFRRRWRHGWFIERAIENQRNPRDQPVMTRSIGAKMGWDWLGNDAFHRFFFAGIRAVL